VKDAVDAVVGPDVAERLSVLERLAGADFEAGDGHRGLLRASS
jgi:hypothetical protein